MFNYPLQRIHSGNYSVIVENNTLNRLRTLEGCFSSTYAKQKLGCKKCEGNQKQHCKQGGATLKLNFEKLKPAILLNFHYCNRVIHQCTLRISKLMQIICRWSNLWQLSACSVIAFLKYIQAFASS